MQCPKCGAESKGKFCEYCGCEIPRIAPETVNNDHSSTTVVNNYYQQAPTPTQPIYTQLVYTQTVSSKSKTVALVLCILLGYFGIHHFYAGKAGMGILYLFTMGLFGLGWIIDIVLIATGSFKDCYGFPIK